MASRRSKTEATIIVALASYAPEHIGSELAASFGTAGIDTEVTRRPPEITATLEWIVPAAIMVFIGQKFFGTILQEAAKDVYPELKRRIVSMITRTSGRNREFDPKMVAPGGPPFEPYANFSFVVESLSGKRVVFPFRLNLDSAVYGAAVDEFFLLAELHYGRSPDDPLAELLKIAKHEPENTVYMRFDPDACAWQPIDTMAEVRKAIDRQRARELAQSGGLKENPK